MKVKIDALDITVLKGGAADVGQWATDHGFRLPPDAPEVLDFYAKRSPIFLAAAFDADAAKARGQQVGDGTPVHITIPTPNPWVPLRILALGKTGDRPVQADVYLLTDRARRSCRRRPASNGMRLDASAAGNPAACSTTSAPTAGMDWVPDSPAGSRSSRSTRCPQLDYDLAVDASGQGCRRRSLPGSRATGGAGPGAGRPSRLLIALAFVGVGSSAWADRLVPRRIVPPAREDAAAVGRQRFARRRRPA